MSEKLKLGDRIDDIIQSGNETTGSKELNPVSPKDSTIRQQTDFLCRARKRLLLTQNNLKENRALNIILN